ncbi:hypothetical protein QWZ13_09895 [Reinekea marina]|nr:hypothetical protein [Reinekea marina]MDN3649223.1 hypothetical protein [Reinekea marina]
MVGAPEATRRRDSMVPVNRLSTLFRRLLRINTYSPWPKMETKMN